MSDVTLIQNPRPRPTVSTPEGLVITTSRQKNYAGVCDVCAKEAVTLYSGRWCRVCPHCSSSEAHILLVKDRIAASQAALDAAIKDSKETAELWIRSLDHVRSHGGLFIDRDRIVEGVLKILADEGFADTMYEVAKEALIKEARTYEQ